MKIEKSREEKESDIISEFVKELDLSDERIKKRLIVESMRQKLFQTPAGEQFLKSLSYGPGWKISPQERQKLPWWKKQSKRLVFLGNVLLLTTGVTAAVIYACSFDGGKDDGLSEVLTHAYGEDQKETDFGSEDTGSLEMMNGLGRIGLQHYSNTYLIKDSDTVRLSEETVKYFTYEQMNLAMHEIYARHGRKFFDVNIQAYFNNKTWYQPLEQTAKYTDAMLNDDERFNIVLLKEQMDQIKSENEDAAYDYGSLTIDDMKQDLSRLGFSEESSNGVNDSVIRAMYYDLMEAGYLVNGKLIFGQVGSL